LAQDGAKKHELEQFIIRHCGSTACVEPFTQAFAMVCKIGWRAPVWQRHNALHIIVVWGFCKVAHKKHFAEQTVNEWLRLTFH
jgi:hypothetical protein